MSRIVSLSEAASIGIQQYEKRTGATQPIAVRGEGSGPTASLGFGRTRAPLSRAGPGSTLSRPHPHLRHGLRRTRGEQANREATHQGSKQGANGGS